ncbi:amino acid racemase [uncultured Enterococcus sp.]|mgnify:CR=1 FL=1|uniref:amino acid racemase n=1 Tax=uncultured Enterococcus sp. TaxID=167972 RepID=UPI00200AB3CC|nr:amino acid racemase [Enterococcus cecorum]
MRDFFTILGGMGTMATESFVRQLNKRTPTHADQDYLNYILYNHATVPDRTAYILDRTKPNPVPVLQEDIRQQNILQPSFIVLTCNTAHYFFEELQKETKIPLLHMPKEAVKQIKADQVTGKVAFLGTEGSVKAGVYERELINQGIDYLIPDKNLQAKINHLIYHDIKENDYINMDLFFEILADTKTLGCEAVILGCTELSLVAEYITQEHDYIIYDAQSILVDRTIERALALREK